MNTPLVSIIIPTYNRASLIRETLDSVLAQTYQNWECIVIDDGSTDNTDEIAQGWCKKDNRFRYCHKSNGGLSSARNYGIKLAKGDYILTLDSDDKFDKTFIDKAVKILNENAKIGIVSCWGIRFTGNDYYGKFKPDGKNITDFLFKNAAIGNSLFRKKCWKAVSGFDEQMKKGYEDWEFYIRVSKDGWETKIIEETLFYYRQHKISMRTEALNKYDKEIKLYIFKKHQDIYLKFYDEMILFFLDSIELNRKNEQKRINSIDFKIGSIVLTPFRFIKKLFK